MIDRDYCTTLAEYNAWMNERLYALCRGLDPAERERDLGAFFGSIHRTLDHLLWADQVWMSRFTGRERPPVALGEPLCAGFDELQRSRVAMDAEIVHWAAQVDEAWLSAALSWTSGADGSIRTRPAWVLVTHLFNHQTHHRGQVTALLTRLGHDPGVTDLPWMPGMDAAPD
jgi:uncharacterized damage-inducible protein DinB